MKIEKQEQVNEDFGSEAYKVGYRKPPKKTQFKKGVSGNPGGRPRGSKNKERRFGAEKFKEIILKEAYRDIEVRDGEEMVTVPMAEAVVRATAVKAAKGYIGSARLFAELLSQVEAAENTLKFEAFTTYAEYKRNAEKELAHREKLGVSDDGKTILPHPDDIIVDPRTGEARIAGPMTQEEWDRDASIAKYQIALEEDIAYLEEYLAQNSEDEGNGTLENLLRSHRRYLKKTKGVIPNSWIEREKKHWTSESQEAEVSPDDNKAN